MREKDEAVKTPLAMWVQRCATVWLVVSLCWFVVRTWNWPLLGDAALMHYVAFLMDHGRVPYRDIWDMNFPGAYVPDWIVQHLFGPSGLAWRLYDFLTLASVGIAMFLIRRRRLWFAALWAAGLFALVHGRDGMEQLGQRDLTAGALLIVGVSFLFFAQRSGRTWMAACWGLLTGAAATVKPVLALYLLIILLDSALEWRAERSVSKRLYFGIAGWLAPLILCFSWVYLKGGLNAFLFDVRVLVPFHASLGRADWRTLFYNSVSPLSVLVGIWLIVLAVRRSKSTGQPAPNDQRERALLLANAALGLLSYLIQQKGYPYHRYPFLAFGLLVIGIDLIRAMQSHERYGRWLSASAFLWTSLIVAPSSALKTGRYEWKTQEFRSLLQADLQAVAPDGAIGALSGRVVCLDTISGCINTLEDLQLIQGTPNLYDEFLFQGSGSRAETSMRQSFLSGLKQNTPDVLVVTDTLFPAGPDHYAKLLRWPEFNVWLNTHYEIRSDEQPQKRVRWMGRYVTPAGFRVYIRRR